MTDTAGDPFRNAKLADRLSQLMDLAQDIGREGGEGAWVPTERHVSDGEFIWQPNRAIPSGRVHLVPAGKRRWCTLAEVTTELRDLDAKAAEACDEPNIDPEDAERLRFIVPRVHHHVAAATASARKLISHTTTKARLAVFPARRRGRSPRASGRRQTACASHGPPGRLDDRPRPRRPSRLERLVRVVRRLLGGAR